jgi:hypothetical protein
VGLRGSDDRSTRSDAHLLASASTSTPKQVLALGLTMSLQAFTSILLAGSELCVPQPRAQLRAPLFPGRPRNVLCPAHRMVFVHARQSFLSRR